MGKRGKDKKGESKEKVMQSKSFDAELDALFKAAGPTNPTQIKAKSMPSVQKIQAEKIDDAVPSSEDSDQEESEDEDGELSSIESDAVISGISEDESEGEGEIEEGVAEKMDEEVSEDESAEENVTTLVHETVSNPSLLLTAASSSSSSSKKRKVVNRDEPQAQRDARSLFIGNLPVHLATSKQSMKALRKHLIACSPYPSITQIDSVRLRSIPFSKPTDDYEARNPDEAEEGSKKRQRSRTYKENLDEKRSFLSGSQKRKVAYINQEINDKADSVNAYVTLSAISEDAIQELQQVKQKDVSCLTASALAALLVTCVNGTLFEERHLRADLVLPLLPSDILQTGLSTVKTADGSLLGASAGATSIDNESRKRTVFVGNLDFEAKEEELRDFFEAVITKERGSPPDVKALDFSQSDKLPPAEEQDEDSDNVVKRLPSWVFGVRIIRDAATQMGKGFGYVRFLDAASVDEIMAIHESEQNALSAVKSGKSLNGIFRRKLKFKGRPLRVSRCKVSKGNVTSSTNTTSTVSSTPNKRQVLNIPIRSRSLGAPTPGGSSPMLRKQQQMKSLESPTRASIPNPKPLHSDPLKTARNAQKRADADRQARRMDKKKRKREEIKRLADGGDKGKVNIKMAKGKNFIKKVGRLGSLATLGIVAIMCLLIQPTLANNEIVNFGPILCRADEVGHLEDKAARQVSQNWPILYPSSKPILFSINPATQPEGVWLILAMKPEDYDASNMEETIIKPERLATKSFPLLSTFKDDDVSPRDLWFKNIKNKFIWSFKNRFSFRINWAPNFAIKVDTQVYSARNMLIKGKITWKANQLDMESYQQEEDLKNSIQDLPLWPCPRLYVHIVGKEEGILIPPPASRRKDSGLFWSLIFQIAEAYIGPLTNNKKIDYKDATAAAPSKSAIPVHLIFEPLCLFAIPQTSLSLLAMLVPLFIAATFFILPPILTAFTSMAKEEKHNKKD